MPTLVQIQCPHCQALMKLKSRDPLGKQVPCPKCKTPFVAKEKAAPQDDYDDYDDYEAEDEFAEDDGFDDDFAPRPKRKSGGKKKSSKKKKKSGSNKGLKIGLIIGGSVLGVALVGLIIWLVMGLFSKKLDLAYLPEDATLISVTRYADIWGSSLVQDSLESKDKDACDKMKDEWGIHPKEIESVTRGSGDGQSIRVVRTTVDMDPEKILKHAGDYSKETYDEKDYYKFGSRAIYFPDSRTAVCGTEDSVKKAIDRGPDAKARDDLKFVDAGYDTVSVTLFDSDSRRSTFGLFPGAFKDSDALKRVKGQVQGASYSSSSVKSYYALRCGSVEDAKAGYESALEKLKEQREDIDEEAEKMRTALKKFGRLSDDEIDDEIAAMKQTLRSVSISRSGDVITAKVTRVLSKRRKKKGTGSSSIRSLARSPGSIFGISSFRRPGFNPRPTRRSGGTSRNRTVMKFEVNISKFTGRGSKEGAARLGVLRTPGIDPGRIQVNGDTLTVYSRPGRIVHGVTLRTNLIRAGFPQAFPMLKGTE